jgi:pimeloyl-ACP methyl ester carboxylesterase
MNASAEHMVHTGAVELCVQSFGDPDDPPILLIAGGVLLATRDDLARRRLAGITAPTLVIHGTEDPVFPIAHGAALAGDIPGARLLELEQTGHELPPAVWDTVIPAILEHSRE